MEIYLAQKIKTTRCEKKTPKHDLITFYTWYSMKLFSVLNEVYLILMFTLISLNLIGYLVSYSTFCE